MLKTSDAFNQAFKSPTRQVLVRVTMKNVVYTNNDVFDIEYVGGSITGETFNIGSVFSNSIKITFTKVIEAVKQIDKIKLEFGIVLADGSKEFVSMGYFFVDKYNPDRNANRTVIEALDQMTQLEREYKSKLTYPARIKDVALEIANLSGSVVDQVSFERLSTSAINKFEGKTYRQALGLIAQFAGGFAIFDRDGKLSIRTLSDPNFAISTAEYFSRGLVKNETMYTLGGISCKVTAKSGDTSTDFMLQSGSPLGNQIALENSSMTQILLDGIYQQLKNTNYYPYTLSWRGNPALEAGDWISMSDTKDNSFKMPNLSYKLSFSGGLKATSSADTSSVSQASASYRGHLKQQVLELQGWKNSAGGWTYTGTTEPPTPKEGDVWFKPNGPDTETWTYEGGKWVFQTSTAGIREAKEAASDATTKANTAKADASTALTNANNAVDKANQASGKADTSTTIANDAKAQASTAVANANKASAEAVKATKDVTDVSAVANDAKTQANAATASAGKAISDAKTAYDKATENSGKIVTANQEIDKVKGSITTKVDKTDFDKSLGRITNAESSITQNANAITQKVSSTDVENILTGKAYATKSEVVQTSNSLTSTIAGVRTDLDGLSIGGQNLALNTATAITVAGTNSENQISPNYVFIDKIANLVATNEFFTLSFSWVANANSGSFTPRTAGAPYTFGDIVKSTGTNADKSMTIDMSPNNQSGKVVIVFKVNSAVANSGFGAGGFRLDFFENGKNLTISNYKLERGNKATDWSVADVDKANQIQVTQMVQDLNGFKTTVSNTYLTTSGANSTYLNKGDASNTYTTKDAVAGTYLNKSDASILYPTKTTVTTQISQSATDITSSVQSWTNDKLTGYSTIQQTNSSITSAVANKADKSQIAQLSDQITSTVANIAVGTNNIIQNGAAFQNKDNWYQDFQGNGFILASHDHYLNGRQQMFAIKNTTGSGDSVRTIAYRVKRNTTYSFSIGMFGGNVKKTTVYILAKSDDSSKTFDKVTTAYSGGIGGASLEYKKTTFTNGDYDTLYIRVDHEGANTVGAWSTLYWTEVMLVEGNTLPASWVMSSGETATQSQITTQQTQINQTAQAITLKADATTVNNISGRVTATESNLSVQSDKITALTSKTDGQTTQISNLQTSYNGLSSTIATVQNDLNGKATVTQVSNLSQTVNSLSSTVATKADKSQITQLATDINLRVKTDDVVNQINVSKESILIAGSKVQITGQTYIENGVIKTASIADAAITNAKIGSLSADKLTVGTLNGANVNIINLNASNISAGTITGRNLSINLDSGEALFQKGIIKKADGNFSVDITNGILESYTSSGGYTLRNGEISFRNANYGKPNSKEEYGGIGFNWYPGGFWSGSVKGISVRGNEGWAIGTSNSDTGADEATEGSLIAGGLESATFAAKKQIKITAGDVYKSGSLSIPPAIIIGVGNSSDEILISSKLTYIGVVIVDELRVGGKATISHSLTASSLNVWGSKNAIHVTRNGVRATPAYETAESYLGDIGQNYTRENCEIWIEIEQLFSDTVNTDLAYQVFLQAYDDAKFWVADFKSDKFLIKSDKPTSRFAWEIKAKRRGYENDRLVLQDDFDNEKIEQVWR